MEDERVLFPLLLLSDWAFMLWMITSDPKSLLSFSFRECMPAKLSFPSRLQSVIISSLSAQNAKFRSLCFAGEMLDLIMF